jgi:hypothetical protein
MEEGIWYESLGNLHLNTFEEIWNSEKAQKVRKLVKDCPKSCWMIGTASPAIKKNILQPTVWVLKNRLRSLFNITQ